MVSQLAQSITQPSQPNPLQFQQSLQSAGGASPAQFQINSILHGRTPGQLSVQEQQSLAQLLVGKTVQMTGLDGQTFQGFISQSQNSNGLVQYQVS